jgi:hypothetical protein
MVCRRAYRTKKGKLFDHEDLDVYQLARQLVAWLDPMLLVFSCSADLKALNRLLLTAYP